MKLKHALYSTLFASMLVSGTANAVSMTIGDVDGFGFTSPNDYENAQGGLPDTDGDGILEPGEFLPDLDDDGNVHVTNSDEFDNRSAAEAADTFGAQWTDISLEHHYKDFGFAPADDALFTFNFTAPDPGDSDYVDHFINLVFGDYDVSPASIFVDGVEVVLNTQAGNEDGLVQLASADVALGDMLDGEVIIDVYAPNEPYVTIDYAFLNTSVSTAPVPEPSILMLLATGLLGLGFSRHLRRG